MGTAVPIEGNCSFLGLDKSAPEGFVIAAAHLNYVHEMATSALADDHNHGGYTGCSHGRTHQHA